MRSLIVCILLVFASTALASSHEGRGNHGGGEIHHGSGTHHGGTPRGKQQ